MTTEYILAEDVREALDALYAASYIDNEFDLDLYKILSKDFTLQVIVAMEPNMTVDELHQTAKDIEKEQDEMLTQEKVAEIKKRLDKKFKK